LQNDCNIVVCALVTQLLNNTKGFCDHKRRAIEHHDSVLMSFLSEKDDHHHHIAALLLQALLPPALSVV
jgi:hypothetical protein